MTIEQRVAKLERQNRWMKRVGGLALAAVACVVLMGQGKPKELPDLVAKSLTIRDENGKRRIEMAIGLRDTALVRLFDSSGKVRATTGAIDGDMSWVSLSDHTGLARATVTVSMDGRSYVRLADQTNATRVLLGFWRQTGGPSLGLWDAQEQLRAVLGVATTVNKRTGAETKTAENALTMYDAKGNVIWQAPK